MIKNFSTVAIIALAFAGNNLFAQTFKADPSKSTIAWVGKKVTGQHNGEVKLSSGTITLDGDAVKSGTFEVDMNSLTVKDLEGEYNAKLVGHLKNDDFFAVDKFPKATLVIKEAKKEANGSYTVKGDLTIKGVTKPITFPATIKTTGGTLTATATIVVDRTLYDIRYGSKSFFDNLGDKAIDNEFTLTATIIANK